MTGRIQLCTDVADTAAVRWLLSLTDVSAGRLVFHPSGHLHSHGATSLAGELLDALGVTGNQRAVGRASQYNLNAALPWLLAYEIRTVIVHGWSRVPLDALELLLELADATGVRLLLTGPCTTERRQVVIGRRATVSTWANLRAELEGELARALPASSDTKLDVFPPMPTDDFPTFRAAMRDTLGGSDFARADALFLATLRESAVWLRAPLSGAGTLAERQPPHGRPLLDRDVLEQTVATYVHMLVSRSRDHAEVTIRVRAAQTAAFHLGWLIQVNLDRLLATTATPSAAAVRSPHTWETLRMYRDPHIGAVMVLAALEFDAETILELPCAAIAPDGTTVAHGGIELPVPEGAQVLLRAQRLCGLLAGRDASAPFVHHYGEPLTRAKVTAAVRGVYSDTGVSLMSRRLDSSWSAHEWFTRWGLCLQVAS